MSAAVQRRCVVSIACVKGKGRNGFKVSAHALCDASAAIQQDVVQVVRQHSRDAAAAVPMTILSVQLSKNAKKQQQLDTPGVMLEGPEK